MLKFLWLTLLLFLFAPHLAISDEEASISSEDVILETLNPILTEADNENIIPEVGTESNIDEVGNIPNDAAVLVQQSEDTQSGNISQTDVSEAESCPVCESNTTANNATGKSTKVKCSVPINRTEDEEFVIRIVNSSMLLSSLVHTENVTEAPCVLVHFYASWCQFSAAAAPHVNALPRLFPNVKFMAVDSMKYSSLNTRYGTVAVPSLLLFHNGQPTAKFNDSQFVLDKFVTFITKYTGEEPSGIANVTSQDFEGPLSSIPVPQTDYILWLAWLCIIGCISYGFTRTALCNRIIECIRNDWREAEAQLQHEHID